MLDAAYRLYFDDEIALSLAAARVLRDHRPRLRGGWSEHRLAPAGRSAGTALHALRHRRYLDHRRSIATEARRDHRRRDAAGGLCGSADARANRRAGSWR